jgi:general stress protein CsbA
VQLPFGSIFSFQKADIDLVAGITSAIENVILPFVLALLSVITQPSLIGVVLIYFLIVLSITAGPSEGDWKAAMDVLFSPVTLLPLFLLVLIANYVFAQFDISILVPVVSLILVSISVVSLGLAVALLLSGVLYLTARVLKRS